LRGIGNSESLRLVDVVLISMNMVNLMLGVEAEFDFTIPQSEMTPENFQSTGAGTDDRQSARGREGRLIAARPINRQSVAQADIFRTSFRMSSALWKPGRLIGLPKTVVGRPLDSHRGGSHWRARCGLAFRPGPYPPCAGIYADVIKAGRVQRADSVRLIDGF